MKPLYLFLLTLLTAFYMNTPAQNTEPGLLDSLESEILSKFNEVQWDCWYDDDGTGALRRKMNDYVKIENNSLVFNFKDLGVRSVNLIENSFKINIDDYVDPPEKNIWVSKVLMIKGPFPGEEDEEITDSVNVLTDELFALFNQYQKEYIEENDKQLVEKRLRELEDFQILSQNYRQMPEKPAITEEQRKFLVQANVRNDEKKYTEALALYEKAVKIDPSSYPSAYYNMALISAQLKKYRYAIFNMKKYLMLVPEAEDARKGQDKIYEWEMNID